MKLLHITPEAPDFNSGGSIGVAQTLISLTLNGYSVDYIGPEINNSEFKKKYNKLYELTPTDNFLIRTADFFRGITNRRYHAWRNLSIDFDTYDAIILDFTKQSYILEKVPPEKLYVRVHNVEVDFADRDYKTDKTLKKFLVRLLAKRNEKKLVCAAHCLVMLTEHDIRKIEMLYGEIQSKIIVPVCVADNGAKFTENGKIIEEIRLLITGSLWYGENCNGIIWFIENVCPLIKSKFKLTIAGSRPSDKLKELIKSKNFLKLIDSPKEMKPYFEESDLVIAPIFNGAGMKVKVAESLSYGKPIVGTVHAFEGYKISNGINSYLANTKEEFAAAVDKYAQMSTVERKNMFDAVRKLFSENYALNTSQNIWKNILEKVNMEES